MPDTQIEYAPVPPEDLERSLSFANPDREGKLPHIGLVGDTYTITVDGDDTKGRFCVVDMHIPPGGGPGLHRHDFEETFIVLSGEIEATFRGKQSVVHAGETINVPANAPHKFHNASAAAVRLICICSPAGQEKFFSKSAYPFRHAPQRRQNLTTSRWRRSLKRQRNSRRNITQNCSKEG